MARRRQGELPGMEQKKNPEVENAAELYHADMRARVKASNKEKVTKAALIAVLKKHGLPSYRDDTAVPPIMITLTTGKEGVKIDVLGEVEEPEELEGDDDAPATGKPKVEKVATKKLAAVPDEEAKH